MTEEELAALLEDLGIDNQVGSAGLSPATAFFSIDVTQLGPFLRGANEQPSVVKPSSVGSLAATARTSSTPTKSVSVAAAAPDVRVFTGAAADEETEEIKKQVLTAVERVEANDPGTVNINFNNNPYGRGDRRAR